MEHFEHCIIGAGVIGLAIAYKLSLLRPKDKILLIESHSQFGSETSSRNSEVIHAGIYYPEKSLKTQLCQQGKVQLYDFCEQFSVPHKRIGKLIIADNESDIQTLEDIQLNAQKSNVELTLLNQKECLKLEPHINAKAALYSLTTGIIDSHSYMQTLLMLSQQQGVLFSPNTHFLAAKKKAKGFRVILDTQDGEYSISCSKLINSSGLHAPTVATNIDTLDKSLIPQYHYCRGHYYSYQGKSPFSHLIYPVPNQQISGLGIHATLDLAGQVRFGPDTQFISKIDYNVHDQDEALRAEVFLKAIRQYFPSITADKLHLSYSGIRPKLSAENEAAKDFMIQTEKDHNVVGLMNLFGIESPGLTASLAIADQVCSLQ